MGHLRFIHSYNTRPASIDLYGRNAIQRLLGHVAYFALSFAYLKRLGATVVLHADSLGAQLLSFLPYDDIKLTLDDMPADIHPRFWAAGKMYALQAEGAGAVHIDGDVFIKNEKLLEDIEHSDWQIISQNYEDSWWYEKEFCLFDSSETVLRDIGLNIRELGAFNTGVIGFKDDAILRKFLDGYMRVAKSVTKKEPWLLDHNNDMTPDVIIEQRWLYQLSCAMQAKTKLVIPESQGVNEQAKALGYQHVLSSCKFDVLDKCMAALKKVSPSIHSKTEKVCRNVLQK